MLGSVSCWCCECVKGSNGASLGLEEEMIVVVQIPPVKQFKYDSYLLPYTVLPVTPSSSVQSSVKTPPCHLITALPSSWVSRLGLEDLPRIIAMLGKALRRVRASDLVCSSVINTARTACSGRNSVTTVRISTIEIEDVHTLCEFECLVGAADRD